MNSFFQSILVTVALLSWRADPGLAFSCRTLSAGRRTQATLLLVPERVRSEDPDDSSLGESDSMGRRGALFKLSGAVAVLLGAGGGGAILPAAWADVSDGNALPEGAAQFGRVIRAKADLVTISKRVSEGASEMDKNEWNNVGGFLRKVYAVGDDMKSIASGLDSEKKTKAGVLVDDLKKYSKAADAPTGSQNGPEFLAYSKKMIGIFDEFLDLLSDVPDEL